MWWMYLIYGIVAVVVLLLAVILIRTFAFKPKDNVQILDENIEFDKQKAISNLQTLVRFKTVSYYDSSKEDKSEFDKLINELPKLYPNVFATCKQIELKERGLLFKWEGKAHDKPSVMMAHFDVVPVDQGNWEKPAFDGIIEDGVLWGRGTLDTKNTFNGVLFSADHLIQKGFVPEQDMYFAFSGTEEINGPGAVEIVKYFKDNGITPNLVVDEGGAVVKDIFPGVSSECGLIGIAEKGMINAEFTVKSAGGHASAPRPHSPIVELSDACTKIENNPTKFQITKPVAEMFDTLGRRSTFVYKMIFANLWLFKGVLNKLCIKSGGELNALNRTTVAFTQTCGSSAPNVIPPKATMVANLRLNPLDTIDSTLAYLTKTVNNDRIEIKAQEGAMNPSPISRTDCDSYLKVASAVASTWKGCIVSPYLMVQCSDSRHYGEISDKVYRFSAMDLTAEERSTIHGNNERIRLATVERAVEFYIRLMQQC